MAAAITWWTPGRTAVSSSPAESPHLRRRDRLLDVPAQPVRHAHEHVRVRRPHAALGGEALLVGADEVDHRDRRTDGTGHVRDDGVEVGDLRVPAEAG